MSVVLTRHSNEQLRLYDLSDKELIAIVQDVVGDDGWSSRTDVAARIFPFVRVSPDTKRTRHAERCVAVRLSWMRRFGIVERHPEDGTTRSRWRLTADGRALLLGRLTTAQAHVLNQLAENRLLAATSLLSDRFVSAGDVAATVMRREWMYGTSRRNGRPRA